MELTAVQVRVLGALVEKDRTTPDSYPLTTNALVAACNQKTSRDPVMNVTAAEVDAAMLELRQEQMARTVRGVSERSFKHRHNLGEALLVDDEELSVVAVLMLRGPQTPGELRSRCERYVDFDDPSAVEATLARLAARDEPLTRNLGRGPGQSQDRWIQLLGPESVPAGPGAVAAPVVEPEPGAVVAPVVEPEPATAAAVGSNELADLRAEVAELRRSVDEIRRELGLDE